MNPDDGSLAALIAPIAAHEFFQNYWDREPLHIRREGTNPYLGVLRAEDVDAFLTRGDIRYPALRMAKNGPTIAVSDYSRILTFGSYAAEGWVDVERVRRLYAEGATIILQLTRSSIPRVAHFANRLQADLKFNIETTIYQTPKNSQGFTTHYDTHGVFVLQIAGTKRWRLYDFMIDLPTLAQTFDTCQVLPSPVRREVLLEPGDLLYIPRGLAHDAVAENDESLHVSVGLFPPLWLDLLGDFLDEMKTDVEFRRSPINEFHLASGLPTWKTSVRVLQLLLRERFDARDFLARRTDAASAEFTQSNVGRLLDTLSAEMVSLETIVARRKEIEYVHSSENGRVNLRYYRKSLTFPKSVAPAIDCVLTRERFPVKDIQANLSDAGKLILVRKLINEGFLKSETLQPP